MKILVNPTLRHRGKDSPPFLVSLIFDSKVRLTVILWQIPKSWLKLIFALHKSDTLRIMWKELIYMGIFTIGIEWVVMEYVTLEKIANMEKLIQLYSLIGFVISLLLVFRTNTAYDRWWKDEKSGGHLPMTLETCSNKN